MSSIAHLFLAGGFVMYPLVIFLLFALMIGIERIVLYRKFTKDLRRFNKVLEKNQSWVMLPSVLERDTEELGSLFARAMRSAKNYNGLENRLQDVVSYADERLKRGLSWLSMIVTMAPLLGLLGTVLGMIRAFAVVGGDIGAPTIITGGVSEALVATATGLTVAIIALGFHSYCAAKVNDSITTLEHECGNILDVVFFLLVFFMVGTLYMNTEQQIPLNLPSASTSTAKSIEPITITLTTTHTLYIDNQEISSDRLAEEVQSIVKQAPRQAFVIRASKDVYYSEVIALLDMLKVNGAKYISVATERK